jgi:hypothetical protein
MNASAGSHMENTSSSKWDSTQPQRVGNAMAFGRMGAARTDCGASSDMLRLGGKARQFYWDWKQPATRFCPGIRSL